MAAEAHHEAGNFSIPSVEYFLAFVPAKEYSSRMFTLLFQNGDGALKRNELEQGVTNANRRTAPVHANSASSSPDIHAVLKAFLVALVFFCQTLPALTADRSTSPSVGCVVFKRAVDAGATFVEYRSYKDFGTAIIFIDSTGEEVRVLEHYGPLFIPYPSDKTADRQKVFAQIQLARKTYPDVSRRLASVEKAWSEAPVPIAPPTAVPQPVKEIAGAEIVTTNGKSYSNAKVTSVDADGITIAHDAGVARVGFADLPDEARKKYGYDPKKALDEQRKSAAQVNALDEAGLARVEAAITELRSVLRKEYSEANLSVDLKSGASLLQLTADHFFSFNLYQLDPYRIWVVEEKRGSKAQVLALPSKTMPVQETMGNAKQVRGLQGLEFAWNGDANALREAFRQLILIRFAAMEKQLVKAPDAYRGLTRSVKDILTSAYTANVPYGYERYGMLGNMPQMGLTLGRVNPTIELWGPDVDLQQIKIWSNLGPNPVYNETFIHNHLLMAGGIEPEFGNWVRKQLRIAMSQDGQRYKEVEELSDGRSYGISVQARRQPSNPPWPAYTEVSITTAITAKVQ
jgi:hypothetical protein